jgi:hypothetical protein
MGSDALLAALCLAPDGGARFERDPEGVARVHGLDADDAARGAAQPRGMRVYRELVRANFADTLAHTLPRTAEALGAGFDDALQGFLGDAPPRTRYLRELPGEFVAHLARRGDVVAPWLLDLARFEWAEFDAGHAGDADGAEVPTDPVSLERPVRLDPSAHALSLRWRAHDPAADPTVVAPVSLLVRRTAEGDIAVEEITDAARALFAALREGAPLGDALRGVLAGVPPDAQPAALAGAVAFVEALTDRGVVRGGS